MYALLFLIQMSMPDTTVDAALVRHAAGTSWDDDMPAMHMAALGNWNVGVHGQASLVSRRDGGPRGRSLTFSPNMVMGMAARPVGSGRVTLRAMLTLEPFMGRSGYPLLFQTGETADGQTPLVDRQHPHDFLMELGVSYAFPLSPDASMFIYAAPIGAPAIGPMPFMHRRSAGSNPLAPVSHHFLDATHIAHGVVTAGLVANGNVQLEFSLFNGREPDQQRWNVDRLGLNSWAFRATIRPTDGLAMQGSAAGLQAPEQLHPGIDVVRLTASVSYGTTWSDGDWFGTLAYGRNKNESTLISLAEAQRTFSQPILDHYIGLQGLPNLPPDQILLQFPTRVGFGLLAESAVSMGSVEFFGRAERVRKVELFPPADVRHSQAFTINKAQLGTAVTVVNNRIGTLTLGASVAGYAFPAALEPDYGDRIGGWSVFATAGW